MDFYDILLAKKLGGSGGGGGGGSDLVKTATVSVTSETGELAILTGAEGANAGGVSIGTFGSDPVVTMGAIFGYPGVAYDNTVLLIKQESSSAPYEYMTYFYYDTATFYVSVNGDASDDGNGLLIIYGDCTITAFNHK